MQKKADGSFTDTSQKGAFEAKGQLWKEMNTKADMLKVMELVEATRTAKSHALNDRSSRSHCVLSLKQVVKSGKN